MARHSRMKALMLLGAVSAIPSARGGASTAGTCGFVASCGPLFRSSTSTSTSRATTAPWQMTVSEGTEAPAPYSGLPADWRAPLPKERPPTGAEAETAAAAVAAAAEQELELQEKEAARGGGGGSADTSLGGEEDGLRTAAEVLQETTRVSASSGVGKKRSARIAEAPPGLEALQTENQRRRALPLSQLKRIKPKRRTTAEQEGEFRPLVAKTDRESVLRGEDYWIDYREVDAKAARKEARAKAPAADQFAQSKMKAEIVNPYKQNWILVISIAIVAIAGFVRINPGILDDPAIITFPTEL